MAKQQSKKKLTNKQIETHLNNLYHKGTQESYIVDTIMKVITDFIEFTGNTDKFQTFLETKYKKKKEEKKDEPTK